MIELYEPQKKAVEKQIESLNTYGVALNCSATGTGKTLMGLLTAKAMGLVPLICCPLVGIATWRRWSQTLSVPVLDVINIEKLRTGKTPYVSLNGSAKKGQFTWHLDRTKHMVIIDEVHRSITGPRSISGRMCSMLRPFGIKTIMMTATPPATPLGLRNIGYLARLHDFSAASFFRFCREHGCTDSHFHRGLEFKIDSPRAKAAMERINRNLQPIMAKVTVEDIADRFQNNIVETMLVSLSNDETGRIAELYESASAELKKKNHDNILVAQTRARQMSERLKLPALQDEVIDLVEQGLNVFVALGYVDSVEELARMLAKSGVAVVQITGKQSGEKGMLERTTAESLFNSGLSRVLVGTLGAAGLSISLHHTKPDQYPRTSLISPSYNAAEFTQALGRIHRAEALSPVLQRIVLAAGTVEEKVARRIDTKLGMMSTLTNMDLGSLI